MRSRSRQIAHFPRQRNDHFLVLRASCENSPLIFGVFRLSSLCVPGGGDRRRFISLGHHDDHRGPKDIRVFLQAKASAGESVFLRGHFPCLHSMASLRNGAAGRLMIAALRDSTLAGGMSVGV